MTEMNRRDYLIKMGAAVGGLASIRELDIFGYGQLSPLEEQRGRRVPGSRARTLQVPQTWAPAWEDPIPTLSSNEVVKLVFHGLSGFGNRMKDGRSSCDVGFHSQGDGTHHHRLFVQAYGGPNLDRIYPPADHVKVNKIDLAVPRVSGKDPRFKNGVYFYQPKYPHPLVTRADLKNDQDFRWIVDFESDYLYRKFFTGSQQFLPKNKNIYKPAFNVPYGLFYTLDKTASTFEVKTASNQHKSPLGPIADWIESDIFVERGTGVTLKINGTDYTVPAPGEIYFFNICFKNASLKELCEPEPKHRDKTKRGDFFLNYKAFKRGSAPELELFNVTRGNRQESTFGLRRLSESLKVFPDHKGHLQKPDSKNSLLTVITDESPCAGAGYGGGGGLPYHP